jgi:hypothetical protein
MGLLSHHAKLRVISLRRLRCVNCTLGWPTMCSHEELPEPSFRPPAFTKRQEARRRARVIGNASSCFKERRQRGFLPLPRDSAPQFELGSCSLVSEPHARGLVPTDAEGLAVPVRGYPAVDGSTSSRLHSCIQLDLQSTQDHDAIAVLSGHPIGGHFARRLRCVNRTLGRPSATSFGGRTAETARLLESPWRGAVGPLTSPLSLRTPKPSQPPPSRVSLQREALSGTRS